MMNWAKNLLRRVAGCRAGSGPSSETFFNSSITSASRGISLIAFSIFSGMSRGPTAALFLARRPIKQTSS
jgi:hypothetical protein